MQVHRPVSVDEAAALLGAGDTSDPIGVCALAGGTDLMPDLNAGRRRPESVVSLAGLPELRGCTRSDDDIVIGSAVTYSQLAGRVVDGVDVGLLTAMARTVGTPASRNAGTLGGALGTARGAGDVVTALLALDAVLAVRTGEVQRRVPIRSWLAGPRDARDLVVNVRLSARKISAGYVKVMHRQAAAPAVLNCALGIDAETNGVALAIGGVGPAPVRAAAAEHYANERLCAGGVAGEPIARRFGELVAAELRPQSTSRASAVYRSHAAGVLAARLLWRYLESTRA